MANRRHLFYRYHNLHVSSRGTKILARGEFPVVGGEFTPGKVSKGDSTIRRGRSASVRTAGYVFGCRRSLVATAPRAG